MTIKKRILCLLAVSTVLTLQAVQPRQPEHSPYKIKKGVAVFKEPKRASGQQSMLGFAAEPIKTVRVGFIGLGMRGPGAVERFAHIENVEIKALCDLLPERVASAQQILTKTGLPKAAEYSGEEGWKALCDRDDLDLVYIVTPWGSHVEISVYAMEHGKHVAVEVPAAQSIAECWQLVDASERTRRHCMMLENCVYDFFELTTLNMAQHGVFGEILHVEGAYIHNLDYFWEAYQGNWRLKFNRDHRGDVYPTHGLGPACQLLNIHRGDKMNYLVSMDTKSVRGSHYFKKLTGEEVSDFKNGDHTLTFIRTQNGKTIHLQHNVWTPRPYSRMYQLTGTAGFANKYPIEGYCFHPHQANKSLIPDLEKLDGHAFVPEATKQALMERYKHPIHKALEERARKIGGHGGMDFVMDYRLVYCLQNGLPLDQDVYDAAEWSCIGELSAVSIEHGSIPVEVPDFTRGDWNKLDGLRFAE